MLTTSYQLFKLDQHKNILNQTDRMPSRSFVQGFLKLLYVIFDDNVLLSITLTSGSGITHSFSSGVTLRSTGSGRSGGNYSDPSSTGPFRTSTDLGIIVGTGTTAVAPTDFQLATQILDGTSAGTLEHFPSSGSVPTYAGNTGSFVLERLFRNSSGGDITINEMGIYSGVNSSSNLRSVCIIRDLVSPGFTLTNGQYGRLTYTVSITS